MGSNLFEEYNNVILQGKILTEKKFNHDIYGEKFYTFDVEVPRLSDVVDVIPVIISERVIDFDTFIPGTLVKVMGQYRSYNNIEGEKNKLTLMVFVKEIVKIGQYVEEEPVNEIVLNGFLCKMPNYRTTPLGREIADMLIAVNRAYNKSDYIPVIAWGRNAKYCKTFEVGKNIKVTGRIQSRTYEKKHEDGKIEQRRAYEVSVSKLELLK